VSTIEPRKNLATLLRAFALLHRMDPRVQLILVGAEGWLSTEVHSLAAELGLGDSLRFLGRVTDEDLAALYRGARLLAHPALDEGFGLPVAEALASGTPVVAARAGSLPEIAGDAALLLDPLDAGAWAQAMGRILDDATLAGRLRSAGPPRVVVGPVAHAWELDGPIDERLTDETAKEAPGKRSPWETSYAAPAPSPVPIGLSGDLSQSRRSVSLRIASTRALRAVTLELLDHHRRGLATRTVAVPAGKVARVDFALAASRVEAVRVKVGEWSTVAFKGYVGESVWLEVGGASAPEP
jgi:hypothetical protein